MRAVGSNAVVKYCEESTWGTTPATPSAVYGLSIRSESFGSSKNLFQSETINAKRCVVGLGDGNIGSAGGMVTDFLPEGMEILFKHLLGCTSVTTTTVGSKKQHVMKGSPTFLAGISLEKDFLGITKFMKYTGVRVNSMTLNLVQEGFHDCNFDFVGKNEFTGTYADPETDSNQMDTSVTPVFPSKSGFTGYQCKVYQKLASAGAYTTAMGNVVSGSISVNNNIETDSYVLGSSERASADYGKRECKGDFTVFFEDLTMYALYKSGAEVSLKFVFDNSPAQDLSADIFVIEFPRCKLGGEAPKITGAGGLNIPMNFSARYDSTADTDVIMTITNDLASVP